VPNSEGYGLSATFTDGVGNVGQKLSMRVDFTCDTASGTGSPVFLRNEGNQYFFQWKSKYACPFNGDESSGLSLGSILLIT
jgi:hypothetical protein